MFWTLALVVLACGAQATQDEQELLLLQLRAVMTVTGQNPVVVTGNGSRHSTLAHTVNASLVESLGDDEALVRDDSANKSLDEPMGGDDQLVRGDSDFIVSHPVGADTTTSEPMGDYEPTGDDEALVTDPNASQFDSTLAQSIDGDNLDQLTGDDDALVIDSNFSQSESTTGGGEPTANDDELVKDLNASDFSSTLDNASVEPETNVDDDEEALVKDENGSQQERTLVEATVVESTGASAQAPPPPSSDDEADGATPAFKVHVQQHDQAEDELAADDGTGVKVVDSSNASFTKVLQSLGTVTAYIQFGKVGSSSIRNILEHRAERHGWPVFDENATCVKHKLHGANCEKKKEHECRVAEEQGLPCGKRLCLDQTFVQSTDEYSICADQPTDSVVQVAYPGFCESLKGNRPCQYITLLREPLDRLISSYNYWCLDCLDHVGKKGIFCQNGYRCPNDMSITDWARRHGNDYTRRLATRVGHETLSDGFYTDDGYLNKDLTEDDLDVALEILQADNMLVLWIEELTTNAGGKKTGLMQLSHFLQDPAVLDQVPTNINSHEHAYVPTKKELAELKEILHFDLRLYEALHDDA